MDYPSGWISNPNKENKPHLDFEEQVLKDAIDKIDKMLISKRNEGKQLPQA